MAIAAPTTAAKTPPAISTSFLPAALFVAVALELAAVPEAVAVALAVEAAEEAVTVESMENWME
jgi:hypothetical protein